MRSSEDKHRVTAWIHKYYIDKMDKLLAKGEYISRSEVIREALRAWFKKREEDKP